MPEIGAFVGARISAFRRNGIGHVTVVRIHSPHIATDIEDFGRELYSLVENGKRQKLLLNLSVVEFFGDAALSKMIVLRRKLNAQGGVLKISNMSPNVHQVFTITKLDRIFDIHEDEADALAAF